MFFSKKKFTVKLLVIDGTACGRLYIVLAWGSQQRYYTGMMREIGLDLFTKL
jgi:hypothetical protein